jgi:hypothetical protein
MEIFTSKNNLKYNEMNKIITVLLILLVLSFNKISAQNTSPDNLIVPLSNPGKPYSLKVGLVSGSITVSSYAGKEIIIEVITDKTKRNVEITTDANNGMKHISRGNSFGITAREDNNIVSVNSDNPVQKIDLNLKIPQGNVKLKLNTVNDGDIEVNNIKGELEINNVNGSITLNGINGSVVGTTVNGNLICTFTAVDPKAPMAFSSLNGNVDVTFPANIQYNMKIKSDRGEIYSDFDIAIDKSAPKVDHSSHSGMYQLKQDDWINGKINGGGPEVMMKNMQGNIYMRKAK